MTEKEKSEMNDRINALAKALTTAEGGLESMDDAANPIRKKRSATYVAAVMTAAASSVQAWVAHDPNRGTNHEYLAFRIVEDTLLLLMKIESTGVIDSYN